jgi:hypothetical protein
MSPSAQLFSPLPEQSKLNATQSTSSSSSLSSSTFDMTKTDKFAVFHPNLTDSSDILCYMLQRPDFLRAVQIFRAVCAYLPSSSFEWRHLSLTYYRLLCHKDSAGEDVSVRATSEISPPSASSYCSNNSSSAPSKAARALAFSNSLPSNEEEHSKSASNKKTKTLSSTSSPLSITSKLTSNPETSVLSPSSSSSSSSSSSFSSSSPQHQIGLELVLIESSKHCQLWEQADVNYLLSLPSVQQKIEKSKLEELQSGLCICHIFPNTISTPFTCCNQGICDNLFLFCVWKMLQISQQQSRIYLVHSLICSFIVHTGLLHCGCLLHC